MSRMKNQYDFMAGIHFGGELYFNKYTLVIDFYTLDESMKDQNIGMDRISHLVYEMVQRSVFIQEDNISTIKAFEKAGIPVLTVPGPGPFDPIILAVLVTKMNAILEDTLTISDAELTSVVGGLMTYVWDAVDDEDEIHETVNDEDDTKWWASSAPRFSSYPAGTDVEEVEETKPFPVTWDALGLAWFDEDTEVPEVEFQLDPKNKSKKTGKVIKANFTGGKPTKPKK